MKIIPLRSYARSWKVENRILTGIYPRVKNKKIVSWDSIKLPVRIPIFSSDSLDVKMYKILFGGSDISKKRRKKGIYNEVRGLLHKSYGFLGEEIGLAMLQNQKIKIVNSHFGITKIPDIESEKYIYEVKTTSGRRITFKKSQLKKLLDYSRERKKRLKILILQLFPTRGPTVFELKNIFYGPSGSWILTHPKRKHYSKTVTFSLLELWKYGSSFWFKPENNLKTPKKEGDM